MRLGKSYTINRGADISFTDHGNPQVALGRAKCRASTPAARGPLGILNVDAIDEIILL